MALAALSSGVETALISMRGAATVRALERLSPRHGAALLIQEWKSNPRQVRLSLTVIGHFAKLGVVACVVVPVVASVGEAASLWVMTGSVVATTIALLVVCDVIPRSLAQSRPERFVGLFPVARLFCRAVWVVANPLYGLWRAVGSATGARSPSVTEEDIEALIRRARREGTLDKEQEDLLASVIDFGDTLVRAVMVPRTETVSFCVDEDLTSVFETVKKVGFSRYPVYKETVDRVIGVFYVKDMLSYLQGPRKRAFDLQHYLREAYFVPETKPISDLMREMQQHMIHLAVIVDEFGGTAGIATQEDIIEEIFGEIYDEFDAVSAPPILELEPTRYAVDARLSVREFEDYFGVELPEPTEFDTLGGFVVSLAGCVPGRGELLEWERMQFTVTDADSTRVKSVEIEITPPPPAEEGRSHIQ